MGLLVKGEHMKKKIDGRPLELWNAGDLLDYLDKCIRDSINNANDLDFEESNTDNRISTVLTTPDFDEALKTMTKRHETACLFDLKDALKKLLCQNDNEKPNSLIQLHITGPVFIQYRYWGTNSLIVDLMRFEVTDYDYEILKDLLDCSFTFFYQKKTCSQSSICDKWGIDVDPRKAVYIFRLRYCDNLQLQFGIDNSEIKFEYFSNEYGEEFLDKITGIIKEVMPNYVKLK